MGRADARSAQIGGPNGKSHVFQVSTYSSEPSTSILARNLLSKDDWRATLMDEPFESGPQVALVSNPRAFACDAERLAWAASRPDRFIIRPSRQSKSKWPSTDTGEEMALCVFGKFIRFNVFNGSFVNDARRDIALSD